MSGTIAFQGEPGAYSHEACARAHPDMTPLPCATFDDLFDAVKSGAADLAMVPVENSTYGRVADIHRMLPESGLHILDEEFVRVRIALMANPGVTLDQIKTVRAHMVLIPQCRNFLADHGIKAETATDSAGAAADLAASGETNVGALASEIAAEIYGLDVVSRNIEDHATNTTRFLIMGAEQDHSRRGTGDMMTSFIFEVRNIPAALYKAMGGFATNGVNITKLESYMVGGSFTATQFYADIVGHPDDENVVLALDELRHFTSHLKILGVYPCAARNG